MKDRKIHGESNVWSAAQSQKKMLGLKEPMDKLSMANSVRLYCHVLRREDVLVLRSVLDFEVEGQRKKCRPKRTLESRLRKKV